MERHLKILRALAGNSRFKIVLLLNGRELCVCELEEILGVSQSAVSQHVRILKEAGLLKETREGQWVFYSLEKDKLREELKGLIELLDADLEAVGGLEREVTELRRLERDPKAAQRRGKQ